MPSDIPISITHISLLFLCLFVNALFACVEIALISSNKNKLKLLAGDNNKKAEKLLNYLENLDNYISTIQIIVTFSGFFASAVATLLFLDIAQNALRYYNISASSTLVLLPVVFVVSIVFITLGELLPKKIARRHSEKVALNLVQFVIFFEFLLKPVVIFVNFVVTCLLIITRQNDKINDDSFSEDEIKTMLEVGQETGVLREEGKKMINSIFDFDDKQAYEAMTPRTDVFYIDINAPADEYIDELMELRYSRIPVYEDDNDNIIGILNIKDYLIKARNQGFDNVDIKSILRKPYFVPETKKLDTLFFELQNSKQHIAILIDEYGGFSGIVTMEDIIEQVMGNIDDEYDEDEDSIIKIDDNTYMLDGFMNLKDISEELDIELLSENSETLGGYIIDILGEIPNDGENLNLKLNVENYHFTIISVKERRIEKVKLQIEQIENEDNDDEEL
ncbi:MAG: hemolysin family protein [Eubacteriales bacterium]